MKAYRGKKRSGKSYNAVKQILIPAIISNRNIFTNMVLHIDEIKKDYPDYTGSIVLVERMLPSQVLECPPGYIIIIDEVYTVWPKSFGRDKLYNQTMEFLAHQFHYVDTVGNCTDVIIMYQADVLVHPGVLALCDEVVHHKKLISLGFSNKYRWSIYDHYQMKKDSYLNSGTSSYESKYFKYYKTQTKNKSAGIGNEKSLDERGVIWKNWKFTLLPALLVMFLFLFIIPKLSGFFGGKKQVESLPVLSKNDAKPANSANYNEQFYSSTQRVQVPAPMIPNSKNYRYAGDMRESYIAYLEHTPTGKFIRVPFSDCKGLPEPSCIYRGEYVDRTTGLEGKRKLRVDSGSMLASGVPSFIPMNQQSASSPVSGNSEKVEEIQK